MWQSLSIQFSIFANNADAVRADDLFVALFGEDPSSAQRNRFPSPDNPFYSAAGGELKDFACQIQVQPARIDIILGPVAISQDEAFVTIDTISSYGRLAPAIIGHDWSGLQISRLSTFTDLGTIASSREEATSRLLACAGIGLPFVDGTDFSFQVNRRKKFSFDSDTLMNRIVRFHEISMQRVQFVLGDGHVGASSVNASTFGAGLLLDYNTVPSALLIEPKNVAPIYTELVQNLLLAASAERPLEILAES